MEFSIPQFIEQESKIVGPFTFKQFAFVGTAAATCLLLFFILPFYIFVILAIFLIGGAFALSFVKIQGIPLPTVFKNFLFFSLKPRIFLWKKKPTPPVLIKAPSPKIEEEEEDRTALKTVRNSRLKDLATRLETKH